MATDYIIGDVRHSMPDHAGNALDDVASSDDGNSVSVTPFDANATWWRRRTITELTTANDTSAPMSCDGAECPYDDLHAIIHWLDMYLIPAVIAVGTVGNLLSFLVFTATYLRRLSSSVYLAALAVVDTVFLIVLLFNWMTAIGVQTHNRPGWCQLFVYATYVTSFLSVWYVACFSVERYVIIQFPLKRQVLCRPRRAKFVVGGMAIIALVVYNFAIWTSTVDVYNDQMHCQVRQGFEQLVTSLNNADTLVTLVVPSALIVFSNVRISYALTQFYRTRQSFDGNASVFGGSLPSPPSSTASSTVRRSILRQGSCRTGQRAVDADQRVSFNHLQLKVTKMLLLVSIVFLLFNTPSHIIRVYLFAMTFFNADYRPGYGLQVAQNYTMHLFYANFAANFALYNASGRTFRRAMCLLGRQFALRVRLCCTTACSAATAAIGGDRENEATGRQPPHRQGSNRLPVAAIGAREAPATGGNGRTPRDDSLRERANGEREPIAKLVSTPRTKLALRRFKFFAGPPQVVSHTPMHPCQVIVSAPDAPLKPSLPDIPRTSVNN